MAWFWMFLLVSVFFLILFFSKQFVVGVETIAQWVSSFVKQDFSAFVTLESVVDDVTFLRNDGGMVSVIEYAGATQIMGRTEYLQMSDAVDNFFARQMGGVGHDLQIIYRQDSGSSGVAIRNALAKTRATANRIGLDIEDVLDAEEDTLKKVVVDESIWIIVSTSLAVIENKESLQEDAKRKADLAKQMDLPSLGSAQNPLKIVEELLPKHEGFVNEVKHLFNTPGRSFARIMDCHEVVSAIRREIQPLSTSPDFRPCLPGDRAPMTTTMYGARPWEDIYYPPIWSQACNSEITEYYSGGMEKVLVDGMCHGTVAMDLPPQTPERFDLLMKRLRHIPFRISYRIYNSGLERYKLNHTLVQFLSFNPKSENRATKNAIEAIMEKAKGDVDSEKTDPALGLALTITTWSESEKTCVQNMQLIQRSMQSWGGCDALPKAGDATDLFVSSLPALSHSTPARFTLNNGSDIAKMLPLFRPASLWKDGAVIFTSPDGRMMPFQPGSSLQNAWVYLIFATMGSGKSVLLNTIELGMCLAPGLNRLPLMTVIDIGESVAGMISVVQSSLPEARKHEAGYFKVKMSAEFAFNVLDTQLGFRFPLARDRDFLRNFLTMIATPAGEKTADRMISELMGMVVDEAYKERADDRNPVKFQFGIDQQVDDCVKDASIKIDQETTWWEVVDDLFAAGQTENAIRAQRYAVPTLSTVPSILKSGVVMDMFAKNNPQGAALIETASIMINSAIRDYPVLAGVTQWDIGSCRVTGIDLNDVRGNGESGFKQTALMYAFAQQSAARNYYIHEDMLPLCKEAYRAYHKERVEDAKSEVKSIIYDEFHNTKGIEGIRRIVSIDIREGRKWNIMVVLASQLLEDFDSDAVDNMTGTFILSASNEGVVKKCKETFGLSESAVNALKTEVVRPGTGMVIFNTKSGQNIQVFHNHLSPIKMWAFTTTAEDKMLRKFLYDAMPASHARRLLARRFPKSGQFKSYIEQQRNRMMSSDDNGNVIQMVADEMIADYRNGSAA